MSGKRIVLLVVDDNPGDVRLVREMLLERPEFEIVVADSLGKATETLEKRGVSACLLDLGLPDSRGLDTLIDLRRRFPDLPVIVFTGIDDDEIAMLSLKFRAQDYLVKGSITPEVLQRTILHAIERFRMERDLREREAELTAIYKNAPIILMLVDRNYRVRKVNTAMIEISGRSEQELLGLYCGEAISCLHHLDEAMGCGAGPYCPLCLLRRKVLETLTTGKGQKNMELIVPTVRKDGVRGEKIFVLSTANIASRGETMALVSLVDITEHRKAEESLRASEECFRQFFENEPGYCYIVSPEKVILDVNRCALVAMGYTKDELVGKSLDVIYAPESGEKVKEIFSRFLQNGFVQDEELTVVASDGRKLTVLLSSSQVRDKDGTPLYSVSVQRDVTEYKRLEEQFRQAQKLEAIGHLAGGMAHDFNNILNVILGYSELSLRFLGPEQPLYNNIRNIKEAADRAASLVRQLLAFSRKQPLRPKIVDLNDLLKRLDDMLRRLIGENIDLAIVKGKDLGMVRADPGQIEQIIMNLVVNARQAMPNGGRLTIETANIEIDEEYTKRHAEIGQGPHVMIAVKDTGCGMDRDTLSRIFEPFFTTKELGRGTGLGLSTVYGIVKQSGGSIWVDSEPGSGAIFKIYLPFVTEESTPVVKLQEKIIGGDERILLAEDDPAVRVLVKESLESLGYRVRVACDGNDALLAIEGEKWVPNLVITDVVMPGMNGKALAEHLAKIRPDLKVLYISGYTDNAIIPQGVPNPGIHFLEKPFSTYKLAAKVREILESR